MKLLIALLRLSGRAMVVAVVAGAISGVSTSCLVALVNSLVHANRQRMVTLAWVFGGLCLLRLLSGVGSHVLLVKLSQGMIRDLRTSLCERILAAPLRDLERLGMHRLLASFSDDTQQIAQVVINVPYLIVNVVILCSCLAYLGWLSGAIFLVLLACLAVGACSYLLPVVYANRQLRAARRAQDELFGEFRSMLEGLKELKLNATRRQQFTRGQLLPAAEWVRSANVRGVTVYSVAANWSRLLFFVYVLVLLFVWPGVGQLGTAAVAGCILVVLYMMAPIEAVINVLPHLAQADVAFEHIQALYGQLETAVTPVVPSAEVPRRSWHSIRLDRISHRYDGADANSFQLGPIDLALRPGEITFVMGGNGCGKTTLAKVLTGLYIPADGQIVVDGQAVTDDNREQYRQSFSAVFTDFHVFPWILQDDTHSPASIQLLLRRFGLEGKVRVEEGKWSTTSLSQGLRKRLALITAVLENRPICVFDEWASDQDPEFRQAFYFAVLPELRAQGRCIVVITHDDRYYGVADRVVRLEDGRIASISALAAANGRPVTQGDNPLPESCAEARDLTSNVSEVP